MKNLLQGIRSKKNWRLKALVLLVGEPNVGKSHTLIDLSKMLLDDALTFVEEKGTVKSLDRHIFARTKKWRIGIGTAGDTRECIKKNFAFFKRMKCDIGIMASRHSLTAFCKKKVSKARAAYAELQKINVGTEYGQTIMQMACAQVIYNAIQRTAVKQVVKYVQDSNITMEIDK